MSDEMKELEKCLKAVHLATEWCIADDINRIVRAAFKSQAKRIEELKKENATLRATAREYIEAHKLMRVRFNDAEDAANYTEAGKKLEEMIDG